MFYVHGVIDGVSKVAPGKASRSANNVDDPFWNFGVQKTKKTVHGFLENFLQTLPEKQYIWGTLHPPVTVSKYCRNIHILSV